MTAVFLIVLIVVSTIAGALATRFEGDAAPRTKMEWIRAVAYWALTIVVAFEMAAGGVWDLLKIEYVRVVLTRLGYPLYLLYIIGIPRIPCALVLLLPRFPRLKEWAYAGAFFNYMGAAESHLLIGGGASQWFGPLLLAAITLVSWALRPAWRRLSQSFGAKQARPIAWTVPVLIVFAMLVAALLTLPKGVPPQ